MAKISNETITGWKQLATDWLKAKNFTPAQVTTGIDAWTVAHRCGICNDAYKIEGVVDAHIKTALVKIFPNAVFKDKYNY